MFKRAWWRLIRLGFRLLYNELAWSYDAISWLVSLGQWRAWQRAALPYVTGENVLEIGHGPGHILLALHETGRRPVGLDLSPAMGRIASKRLRQAMLGSATSHSSRRYRRRSGDWGIFARFSSPNPPIPADILLVCGRAQTLPFAPATFDSVLAIFPTDFVMQPETLAAVYRVLKPGGRFVVVPEGHLTGSGPLTRFIEWLYLITGQRGGNFWPEHASLWSGAASHFTAVGFQVEIKHIQLQRSGVTVIIAHKPS